MMPVLLGLLLGLLVGVVVSIVLAVVDDIEAASADSFYDWTR